MFDNTSISARNSHKTATHNIAARSLHFFTEKGIFRGVCAQNAFISLETKGL